MSMQSRHIKKKTTGTLSRRYVLKAAGIAAAACCAPAIIPRRALSGEATLRILSRQWEDFLPQAVLAEFEKVTGIRVEVSTIESHSEMLSKLRATGGTGFDLTIPAVWEAEAWKTAEVLQPWRLAKIDANSLHPVLLKYCFDQSSWGGGPYLLPYQWSTEAIAWRADEVKIDSKNLSYGDLWREETKGRVTVRPWSGLIGIGLYLDRIGQVPSDRLLDAYRDEERMRQIFDGILEFAIDHKPWVTSFWYNSQEPQEIFMTGRTAIGQMWDWSIRGLKTKGEPIRYQAPVEGALTWIDGLGLLKGADNLELAYAFVNFVYQTRVNAEIAEFNGYNPVVRGAEEFLTPRRRKELIETVPGDLMERLWFWRDTPPWWRAAIAQYIAKWKAA